MAPPEEFPPASCTPNPAPPPRTRGGGAAPPWGRRRASRRLYSVRTPRGWLGPLRGEFLAPNSPLGPPPVLLADFWAAGRARNPLDFVRWVEPIKARGRYTLCSAIHRAEGVRRAWNSHFKLLIQVALASGRWHALEAHLVVAIDSTAVDRRKPATKSSGRRGT
jgi:hypothetical protein